MQTYLRYIISARSMEFPYKAPNHVQEVAEDVFSKCKKYAINEKMRLVLVPIDTVEYELILEFKSNYSEFTSNDSFYEHKYSKNEIANAEYLLLKSSSLVLLKNQMSIFSRCKDENSGHGLKENFIINSKDMAKKIISFTNIYRFIIANDVKTVFEEEKLTNISYLPVYSRKKDIVAYQIEAVNLMESMHDINKWEMYKKCDQCGLIYYNPIQNYPIPFSMPKEYKSKLGDFNATQEVFTEVTSRYYIISRHMYNTLLNMGAKKLCCEPINFI